MNFFILGTKQSSNYLYPINLNFSIMEFYKSKNFDKKKSSNNFTQTENHLRSFRNYQR